MSLVEDNVWKSWEKGGKGEFMKKVKSRLPPKSGSPDPPWWASDHGGEVRRMVYELLWKTIRKSVRTELAVQAIGEMAISHPDVANVVVDVFTLVDTETSIAGAGTSSAGSAAASSASSAPGGEKKDDRERFKALLKEAEKFLPEGTLKERVEVDTLGEVGVLKAPKKFFNTIIKLKTKLFYKQQKFNLFREECEGYAKLVTELNQDLSGAGASASEILGVVKSIIGYFNLDPNRVLDLILESFERHLDSHEFFAELIRLYTPDDDTLAELLAFKFKFYEGEEGGVPASLYRQAALLVQHGILGLEQTWAMLAPVDDASVREEAEKELKEAREFVRKMNVVSTNKEKGGGGGDEDGNGDGNAATSGDSTGYPSSNQKFGFLEGLLSVGAWKEAETLLSRLPAYYATSKPAIAKALQILIHQTIDPLHRRCCGSAPVFQRSKRHTAELPNSAAPSPVTTFDEFGTIVVPMLLALGPYAFDDVVLLYKVVRILKSALGIMVDGREKGDRIAEIPPSSARLPALYHETLTLADEVLLPSLSLTESNCCLAEEIWSVLRAYPYHCRYRLYGQWKTDTYATHPRLLRKKAKMQRSVKRIMQRISKDNVKPTSRQLGKLTHSSPGLLFDYILSQIQLYDNMIGPVVDSLKYLTSLSFDVLGYSIIEALNNPEKDRTKHDGTSISLWLQSLSNFCGAVFKKYNIELTGIMQYVANQLKNKKSLDLLILKEVVLKMSGVEAAEDMTNEQIDAMSGGELLRQEAGSFSQIKNTRKSSLRLKDSLIDSDLAVPLCLLMAQQRNCVVYRETAEDDSYAHLKLVGKLFDQCQDTLVQFGTFLASNLSVDDYTRRLPPMEELLVNYHVNLDLAFFLARPMFNHQISLKYEELRRQERKGAGGGGGDRSSESSEKQQRRFVEASAAVMHPVTEAIRPLHPLKIWDDISPLFLTTFWSLTMYDLAVPTDVYAKELAKLKAAPAKIDENKELNSTRKKKEKERIASLAEKLSEEQRRQKEHVDKVMARLQEEKDGWFFSRQARMAKNETITNFLQLCLFPRCVFTASDAIYCAKFVQIIHMLKTPNFSTLICFDRIFCDITYTVTSCTENEAHRYGRFLAAMLEVVMHWHSNKETFDKECVGYPGFVTKFRVATKGDGQANSANASAAAADANNHVDYENFRHVCHKWHYKIAKALVVCLESKDYVQIRNALTVLFKILPFFPVIVNLAGVIEKRIEKVCAEEKEQRKDLFVMATSYMGQLKSRKPSMMKEHEFHQSKKGAGGTTASSSSNGHASTPEPASAASGKKRGAGDTPSKDDDKKRRKSKERDSSSRSQSREKSVSKSTGVSAGRKGDRDSHSRERSSSSKERGTRDDEGRKSRERGDRQQMGPPSSTSSGAGAARRSAEPSAEDKDSKRRKVDQDDCGSGRRSSSKSRERSVESSSPSSSAEKKASSSGDRGKKRDRDSDGTGGGSGSKKERKEAAAPSNTSSALDHSAAKASVTKTASGGRGRSGAGGGRSRR